MTEEHGAQNSYLLDTEEPAEMARLINLDQLTTRAMGGPLAEQSLESRAQLRSLLDLGCGPGGWVLDVAFSLPDAEVAGVDISNTMIAYANARARSQEVKNASFEVMDITKPLDFADASFDLVNARFLMAALPAALWPSFLAECTRLVRPGGIIRFTEMVDPGVTTSPAFERMQQLLFQIMHQRGYGFAPLGNGFAMTTVLPRLLRQAGYPEIYHAAHALEFSSGAPGWGAFYDNTKVAYRLALPLYVQPGLLTEEEAEALYNQMLIEMQAEDFAGMWHFVTFWARKAE